MEFKNKLINGIYTSQYVASYENAGGKIIDVPLYDRKKFISWLKSLTIHDRKLTKDEIYYIYRHRYYMRTNGNSVLEYFAKEFLKGA